MPDEIRIREMTIGDYDLSVSLWKSVPGIGLSSSDSRGSISRFIDMNPDSCFVAESGGAIIGTAMCGTDGRRAYLYHLAVSAEWRKCGIGTELVEACLGAMREKGIAKCHLMGMADNTAAIGYYGRKGWTKRTDLFVFSKDI